MPAVRRGQAGVTRRCRLRRADTDAPPHIDGTAALPRAAAVTPLYQPNA
jgi:hypothetical protein